MKKHTLQIGRKHMELHMMAIEHTLKIGKDLIQKSGQKIMIKHIVQIMRKYIQRHIQKIIQQIIQVRLTTTIQRCILKHG